MFRAIKVYGKILQDLNQQYSSLKFLRPFRSFLSYPICLDTPDYLERSDQEHCNGESTE